jgi:hypothetical protein
VIGKAVPEGSGLVIEIIVIEVVLVERLIVIVCDSKLIFVSEGWVVMLDVRG